MPSLNFFLAKSCQASFGTYPFCAFIQASNEPTASLPPGKVAFILSDVDVSRLGVGSTYSLTSSSFSSSKLLISSRRESKSKVSPSLT